MPLVFLSSMMSSDAQATNEAFPISTVIVETWKAFGEEAAAQLRVDSSLQATSITYRQSDSIKIIPLRYIVLNSGPCDHIQAAAA